MKRSNAPFHAMLLIVAIIIAGAYGWVANVVEIAGMSFDTITGMLVLRVIGIFIVPLGAILGYF